MAQNEETTAAAAAAEAPILCANNCGFFGKRATMNLCSKCFRSSATARVVPISSASPRISEEVPVFIISSSSSSSSSCSTAPPRPQFQHPAADPSRCFGCRKRVGLTGFKCRCGNIFCGSHRYSDKHDCSFDYKAAGRESIAKANPVVIARKINKI